MNDIDSMDMLGFFRVRAWDANRSNAAKAPKRRYIDEVWPGHAGESFVTAQY